MSAAVRAFERRDRDQLTALVNLHVAAVIPGVVLSVNAVLGQLEREPDETVVDPWVAERRCLVAEQGAEIVAAVLLHRFRDDKDVKAGYRNTGEVRWLVCRTDAADAGRKLLEAALEQMQRWKVASIGADCTLPALGCYGIPDTFPHIRELLLNAGFSGPSRTELVLVARCEALTGQSDDAASVIRTLGLLGTRLTLVRHGEELGFIEVCEPGGAMARSSVAARWADVGNLSISDRDTASAGMSMLLSAAAEWLLLGGVTRLVHYWAKDVDLPDELARLQQAGFQRLVTNERGFQRPA